MTELVALGGRYAELLSGREIAEAANGIPRSSAGEAALA